MKNYVVIAATMLIAVGCTSIGKNQEHSRIEPLESSISLDSLDNCTVAAAFSTADFNWRGGNLDMTIYDEYRYDSAEVSRMQPGDTIIYEGKPMPVDSIERKNNYVTINGGIENNGAELTPQGKGAYRAVTLDDHSVYKKLGKRNVALAQDFVMIDCGTNPDDPNDTISSGQKPYFDQLKDYRRDFSPLNTRVTIKDGIITKIQRHWIP